MAHGSYGVIPLFLLGALSGIAMTILLSTLIEQLHRVTPRHALGAPLALSTGVLVYLGQNALIILAMHIPAAALASHWLGRTSGLSAFAVKVLAGLLLLASVELFKRCPLVIPRSPSAKPSALPLPPAQVRP